MLRLLICDDSPAAREVLHASLADQPQIEIVGEAANGEEAIALASATSPDVVLMDIQMPVLDGVSATRRIRELLPETRIVAYAGSSESEDVMAMIEAGAHAYCVKGAPLWELERAVAGASDPLLRLAHSLARSVNAGGAAELVARELADLTGAAFAATYLASSELSLSLASISSPDAPESLRSAPGVVATAFSELRLVHASTHELGELYRLGVACPEAIAAPLVADGEPLGAVLVVMPAQVPVAVDPELVAAVADLASVSLASERRLAQTYAEARRDALTGLANRRAFDEQLTAALHRAGETGEGVSVALLDLDDFKAINDREGHAVGDEVLRETARAFLRVVRALDDVYRIGGEEFAVIIDGGVEVAKTVAERVRAAFAEQRRGYDLPTVSVGIAVFPVNATSGDELLRKADAALYAAKLAGKDRVQVFQLEIDETDGADEAPELPPSPSYSPAIEDQGLRLLIVDDDAALRMLLRTTFEVVDIEVDEAIDAAVAERRIAERTPDVIVLDVGLPGTDGLTLCRKLKEDPATSDIGVVLLTGADEGTAAAADSAGADAFVRKPFSPLELLSTVERVAGSLYEGPFRTAEKPPEEQLILYAQDLRRLLEIERGQRTLLRNACVETVTALASAMESKDVGTGAHSQRVRRYAIELAEELDPALLEDESAEYGFLLHDVGKIAVPDRILKKHGALTPAERRLFQSHTVIGEQMLSGVSLLRDQGLQVVRFHHERWDGAGYPDGLGTSEIPLSARVFAVADALDAMMNDRPYHPARTWEAAAQEITIQAGKQFDPDVVDAFRGREPRLRRLQYELAAL